MLNKSERVQSKRSKSFSTYHSLSEVGKREFADDCVLHQDVLGQLGAFDENLVDDVLDVAFIIDLLGDADVDFDQGS